MIAGIVIPKSGTGIKFSYLVPEELRKDLKIGKAVIVPFKNRTSCGYVYEITPEENPVLPKITLKNILAVSKGVFFNETHRAVYDFLSFYYHENISRVLETVLPGIDAKGFGLLDKYYEEAAARGPSGERSKSVITGPSHKLTEAQGNSIEKISLAMDEGLYKTFLVHGVTASGKTEIYFNIIEHALKFGRQGIITVPEIFITNQFIHLIKKRFRSLVDNGGFAVFHSKISRKEKLINRFRILNGDVKLILGARSAVFAPLVNPGLLIVDEEHDGSYKQQSGLLYNARDVSVFLANKYPSICVLGSATPSLESYYNAVYKKKYEYIYLEDRVKGKHLPQVQVVDLRNEFKEPGKKLFKDKILSGTAIDAIKDNLSQKRQVILFLNRRGFSTFLICKSCGHRFLCKNCAISLVYHRGENKGFLECHYCGYKEDVPALCPECGSDNIESYGVGVQKLEDEIKYFLSEDKKVERIDSDIARGKNKGQEIFRRMKNNEIDILIGTQIITKGLDFPNVGLVVVVLADSLLNFPDFRSFEKAFQVLTQVSGRAGRGDFKGNILVQTFTRDNYVLKFSASHDAPGFYEKELNVRKEYGYPPFSRIAVIRLISRDTDMIIKNAGLLNEIAGEIIKLKNYSNIKVLGPSPCPIEKIKNNFRYQVIFKSSGSMSNLHALLEDLKRNEKISKYFSSKKFIIDVDPDILV